MYHFEDWIKAYMTLTEESEAPSQFHFWAAVSTIAGALRRRVWIEQFNFQWTPNFYIVFVAPPGIATKSTTMSIGAAMLSEVQGVHLGPQSLTWQGLSVALEEAKDIVMRDDGALYPMSCLTIHSSELGTFLKPKDEGLVDFLVDMWDGKKTTWRHRVKTGEKPLTEIINPWINFIGCTTPAWLRGNFPTYMIEGGLTSRCVFLWGDGKRKLVAYPSERIDAAWYFEQRRRLVEDLARISDLFGEFTLTPEAKKWGTEWYEEHWRGRPVDLLSEKYGGYLARKQTHIHKLAMVLSVATTHNLTISLEALKKAEYLVTSSERDLAAVFKSIGMTSTARVRQDLLSYIHHHNLVAQRRLFRDILSFYDKKDIEEALAGLIKSGQIREVVANGQLAYTLIKDEDRPEASATS